MRRVVVHIDRLVLNGSPRGDRDSIGSGLRQELGRALRDRETARHLGMVRDVSRLHAGPVHIAHDAKPQRIGRDVGRAIGREITR
jgi:hypothetical protein